jgi:hypothetical protein
MNIRLRWARIKFYLHLYNDLLRHAVNADKMQIIIRNINNMWDKMSEAERKYIVLHEAW